MKKQASPRIDIDHLQRWVGREQVVSDDLSPFKARALCAALTRENTQPVLPESGSQLPPAWQWLYFVDTPSAALTGRDGHPKTGDFLPPVPLPRRMWAAGKFKVIKPLTLSVSAEKHSVVSRVELKNGSTGSLVFVTLKHSFFQHTQLCVEEQQNIVYREMPSEASPLPQGELASPDVDWTCEINPDPVLLFRFSALTYNGHRIHYDRQYAVDEEFYPGLVVHGPLQAALLANSVAAYCPNARIDEFSFRAKRPLFDSQHFHVCGKREGNHIKLWTRSHEGFVGMTASATLSTQVE
ncbi:MAG: acyl-CoA dehydrogenase [Spongiibacteraceae bacterium]|nr:acyl-CoA dehydrogenase [Spongiibacteraceae bacterium]